MNVASTQYLFIFLPFAILLYYIIPCRSKFFAKNFYRNLYLIFISVIFYAWGEPLRIIIIVVMTILTYYLGIMATEKRNTKQGKWAVALTVIMNVGILFFYKYIATIIYGINYVFHSELPSLSFALPLGLSFFCFSSISYVVDIYRGKFSGKHNFITACLYLSVFFKITMGPIVQYNQFQKYVEERSVDYKKIFEGITRIIIGLGKKVILAGALSVVTKQAFNTAYVDLPVTMAWIGAFAYMLELYFDFSGYTDIAIGSAKMFGFDMPENFNYPYAATSVTEYWQRWHKTLGEWFRDYLYYPLTLGPAIKIRKRLSVKHSKAYCKLIINIFTLGIIWLATAVWHGKSINYLVWGFINGFVSLLELYKKPLKNPKLDRTLGWIYTFFIALMVKTLTYVTTMGEAINYYGSMFGLQGNLFIDASVGLVLHDYWIYFVIGTIAAFPLLKIIKQKVYASNKKLIIITYDIISSIALIAIFILSIALSQRSGVTVFMYQQF